MQWPFPLGNHKKRIVHQTWYVQMLSLHSKCMSEDV